MLRSLALTMMAAAAIGVFAQDQSRLSSDIIDTYSELIARNPGNSDLYLSRATEYASHGLMSLALTDLNDALRLAPKSDKGLRYEILTRRAAILEAQLDYEAALADFDEAATLIPDQPQLLLTRGRLLAGLRRYDEARESYNSYRRRNPRSADAIFGLARIYALEGNSDRALALMNEGIEAAPRDGTTYLSAADIQSLLGRPDDAVSCLITAIGCGDEGAASALQRIVDMSADSYPTVINGLSGAISKNPTSGELYYLRGSIAQDHDHHREALADFDIIDGSGPFVDGALGEMTARSLYALSRYDDAMAALDRLPVKARGASWHTLRSNILLINDQAEQAMQAAVEALLIDPSYVPAMEAKARALVSLGRNADASAEISSALFDNPEALPELYFIGADLATDRRATALMEQAAALPFDPADPSSLRGFAMLRLGQQDEAIIWASTVSRFDTAADGVAYFTAAALYANAGKPDDALRHLEAALKAGFDNLHLISTDTTPGVSLLPLRSDSRFRPLIDKYFPTTK